MNEHTVGDGPIEQKHRAKLRALAETIDEFLNPYDPKDTGFIVLMFPFEASEGRCNYISNADRQDVMAMLREQLSYFEGMPSLEGHA